MLENQQTIDMTRAACQAYKMADAELGAFVTRMSTASIAHLNKVFEGSQDDPDFAAILSLFSDILPEISTRLFKRDGIVMGLHRSKDLCSLTATELRIAFIDVYQSEAFRDYLAILHNDRMSRDDVRDSDLIASPTVNGNIVVLALDRLAPPSADNLDRLARIVKSAGSIRGVESEDGRWTPDFTFEILRMTSPTLVSDQLDGMVSGQDDLDVMDSDDHFDPETTVEPDLFHGEAAGNMAYSI